MNSFGLCPVKELHWAGLFVILSIVVINYRQGTALFHSLNKLTVISFILDKYLQDAGSILKKLVKENVDQAAELFVKVMEFKERRLTVMSKHPIYVDLDSYLHIYIRHVEEFQVTEHFEDKDNFQWNEEDIFSVMGHVIKDVEKEYEDFREKNPNKRYSRYGDYSMYFEGDYYTFHIETNGRVSTFHKNRKEHEKK